MTTTTQARKPTSLSLWPIMMFVVAILMTAAVFTVTQSVKQNEARAKALNNQILTEQQAMRVLNAEWAYLTRPQRLEELIALKTTTDEPTIKDTAPQKPVASVIQRVAQPSSSVNLTPVQKTQSKPKEIKIVTPVVTKKMIQKPAKKDKDIVWSDKKNKSKKSVKKSETIDKKTKLNHGGIAHPILE
jgi:type II secretory pathway pseudopilin PulG